MLTLFHHGFCPHSRFIRLALGEHGLSARPVEERVWERREEFQKDIDVFRLASEMLVDAVVPPSELRGELITRLGYADTKQQRFPPRRSGVYPV